MSLSVIRHRTRFKYSWSNHSWNINLYREHNTSENKAFPGTSPVYFSRSAILESYLRVLKSYYKTPRICCKGVIWKYILNMCVCVAGAVYRRRLPRRRPSRSQSARLWKPLLLWHLPQLHQEVLHRCQLRPRVSREFP